jgi:hypothetical protein
LSLIDGSGDPVAVVDVQRVQDGLPAVDFAGHVLPALSLLGGDEVQHLERGLFGWEVAAVADSAAEAGVQRLDQ